ncbi:hypothetical protein Tco_0650837 [Tanacetum coccineum]
MHINNVIQDQLRGLELRHSNENFFVIFLMSSHPNRRLRQSLWRLEQSGGIRSSRLNFDGRIHEAPSIPTPVKLPSRFDVPKNVDPRYDELINSIKELKKKNEAHEKDAEQKVYKFYQGQSQPKPMEVPEHYGLSDFDFSVLQNNGGTTIASSYPSVGAWSNSAIVRLSAIVSLGGSTRFGGTCCCCRRRRA